MDISVEVARAGAIEPWLIWVWECKDYAGRVPVDDVEEFHAKLEQIGADRTKGTIIARGAFQAGALTYARSKGIGLARMLPEGQVRYSAEMTTGPLMLLPIIEALPPWLSAVLIAVGAIVGLRTHGVGGETVAALTQCEFVGRNRAFYAKTSDGRDGPDDVHSYVLEELKRWGVLRIRSGR